MSTPTPARRARDLPEATSFFSVTTFLATTAGESSAAETVAA